MTFKPVRTFARDGQPIAEIKGEARTLYIHREQGRYFHWDRPGLPVRNQELIEVAEKMLPRPQPKPRRPKQVGPYPDRQCCRCTDRFTPKGPASYICPECKSVSMKRIGGRGGVAA